MTQVTITLSDQERKALDMLAAANLRNRPNQARVILREAIERAGLLVPDQSQNQKRGVVLKEPKQC